MNDEFIYSEICDQHKLSTQLLSYKDKNPDCGFLAMVAEQSQGDIARLQTVFSDLGLPMLGAMFPELLVNGEFKKSGVLLLPLKQMPPGILIDNLSAAEKTPETIAGEVADIFDIKPGEHSLLLIFDCMVPNISTLLDALFIEMADEFHFIGANAGSETFQPTPCLFDNHRLVGDAMLAILLADHPGASLEHGYTQPEHTIIATATKGNCINSIDWRPAFDVYTDLVKEHYGKHITTENFYEYSTHFPFGILRIGEQPIIRIPVAMHEDGSLFCVGEIPENSLLTLMQITESEAHDTVDSLLARSGPTTSNIMLGFYCAGRRVHMGERAQQELEYWRNNIKPSQLVGALSLGEISSSYQSGYPLFHNAALVYLPWNGHE